MSERDAWADFEAGVRLVRAQPEQALVVTPQLADAVERSAAQLYGMLHACGGSWAPCAGWTGRYRCDRCGAFGYRRGVNDLRERTREHIVAYCCATKGCGQPAVAKDRGKWRCAVHRRDA